MERELLRYKNYSREVKWFLIVPGLWPTTHPILKKFLALFSLFSMIFIGVAASNFAFHKVNNIFIFIKGMGQSVSFYSSTFKALIFLLYEEDLIFLNEYLSMRYKRDLEDEKNRSYLLYRVATFNYLMNTYMVSTGLTVVLYAIVPIIVLFKYDMYIRMYTIMIPFVYQPGGSMHWILYFIEILAGLSLWIVSIGVDSVFGLFSLNMCGELRLLAREFSNLRVSSEYRKNFKECIEKHRLLLKVKRRLENIFGPIALWLAISGAIVLCAVIFQASESIKTKGGLATFGHMCLYMIPKFLQIFTYAWYGNILSQESEKCVASIYYSQWPDLCEAHFKNDIMMVLTQKPIVITACGCMNIHIDMFTNVLNTSVSYFFLLQTLSEKSEPP